MSGHTRDMQRIMLSLGGNLSHLTVEDDNIQFEEMDEEATGVTGFYVILGADEENPRPRTYVLTLRRDKFLGSTRLALR